MAGNGHRANRDLVTLVPLDAERFPCMADDLVDRKVGGDIDDWEPEGRGLRRNQVIAPQAPTHEVRLHPIGIRRARSPAGVPSLPFPQHFRFDMQPYRRETIALD